MKEYMLLFRGGKRKEDEASPEKWQKHMQHWAEWMGSLNQEGKFVSAQPLNAGSKQVKGPAKAVTDGPFAEAKEMVGGYLICKAENYDAAVEIAKGCPILEFEEGTVEVRQVEEMKM